MFPNIDRIKNIDCPTFIIHGRRDEIVHVEHSKRLVSEMKNKTVQPYFIDKLGHLEFCPDYYNKIT